TSATQTTVTIRANGDSGSNYDYESLFITSGIGTPYSGQAQSQAIIFEIAAATAPSNVSYGGTISIPNYTSTTFNKTFYGYGGFKHGAGAGAQGILTGAAFWRSSAAISSLLLTPTAGNFIAGSAVRVYGEPASAAGPSVGTGTRSRISTNQSVASGSAQVITWDVDDIDADNQHFTSAANLTGTLQKTSGSTAIVGTSTLFTTELSVGQVISVPGTAAEVAVVIAIADATHLTVNSP